MNADQLALLPLWYVAFLLSLTCHEAAHALAAKWGGDLTAYHAGQVTLNPTPHIRREMFGTVLVPLMTFVMSGWMLGWGSAPYDAYWEQRYPRRASAMALAGPLANLAIVLLAAVAIRALIGFGVFSTPDYYSFSSIVQPSAGPVSEGAARFISILFSLNLLLAFFNLLPVAPLDGHSAIGLVLPESVHSRYLAFVRQPLPSLLGLLLAWRLAGPWFSPVLQTAVSLLYVGA